MPNFRFKQDKIVVNLTLATICFMNNCYPILVGDNTPTGIFDLNQRIVLSEGYGGDVIQFKETDTDIFSIHRVWLGNPRENRLERLESPDPKVRSAITNGCINVQPFVYDELLNCCLNQQLEIVK